MSDIRSMIILAEDDRLKLEQRIAILFALGEVADKKGNHVDAFEYFRKANQARQKAMKKLDKTYDPFAMDRLAEKIISEFSETNSNDQNSSSCSRQPVFVLGLPRSGTTLVAQILASHPEVESRGEAETISSLFPNFPKDMKKPNKEELIARTLAMLASTAPRVIDKTPFHFIHIGLIRRIFPNASIILCLRDRLDVGLSCYFQNFKTDYPWSTDLENIGRFINFHDRLISYWQTLYGDNIHEVTYETLIAEPEIESRRLIEHIGLAWDDICLSFYKNKNAVFTAANWQVRQPIYNKSVKRAQYYKDYLTPLFQVLNCDNNKVPPIY